VTFPLLAALVFLLPTLGLAALVGLVLLALRRPQRRWWRLVLWAHLALFPTHLFATFPLALGWVGAHLVGTRPQERAYQGPRLLPDGRIAVQTWASLAAEVAGKSPPPAADVLAAAKARARTIASTDDVTLRAFRVEATVEPPKAVVLLVHGLFRSAMELEPIAQLFRDEGCECWLLDLRNFGGSSRNAPFTAGLRESDDVVAAARFVRSQPGRATTPLVVFGVSMGTAAVALALPRIDGVAGFVLDAPIDDVPSGARRMLALEREGDARASFRTTEPWASLIVRALGLWAGVDVMTACPSDALATLPHDIPCLIVGAGRDDRAPWPTVQRLFARLPMHADDKQLWHAPDAWHGRVFLEQPDGYRERLRWLLGRLRR
jgi:pimeloyl-ACP methyl ester carboxylesterase